MSEQGWPRAFSPLFAADNVDDLCAAVLQRFTDVVGDALLVGDAKHDS